MKCKATTASGKNCSSNAVIAGVCLTHFPWANQGTKYSDLHQRKARRLERCRQ